MPSAGLNWLVLAAPERLTGLAWLEPALGRVLRDERLDLLARATGIDLRQVPELVVGSFGDEAVACYFVRHRLDSVALERLFRRRLTSAEHRSIEGHQLTRMTGRIGRRPHAFVALGRDVVGYQIGGDVDRGPARIALLFAAGRLRRSLSVDRDPLLAGLCAPLGQAPLQAIVPGPFEGELGRGARGLLGGATAVAAHLGPSERQSLALAVHLDGDYSVDTPGALQALGTAWQDLAASDLGHLLGLHQPTAEPVAQARATGLSLHAELDPQTLLSGLAAATTDSIADIMR